MGDMQKPFDPKKSYWCPDGKGGYAECMLVEKGDTESTVMMGHIKKVFKTEELGQVNPRKFEKCEDMANLTYLNDASVFHNLEVRYKAKLIYTYSGLFCVVVNPYKRYPIYTPRVVQLYLGKRKNEVPPHLWAVTETAYRSMLSNHKNQSMLITGESGAGKTENTKKVIAYLAMVATSSKKAGKKVSLEDQIVATNPIMESYGNAKTSINDNEELEYTDNAFDILGFPESEKWCAYRITAAVMSFGEVHFKTKGRDDQAEPDEMEWPTKVAALLGVDVNELMKAFCKPKIKVGTEWV